MKPNRNLTGRFGAVFAAREKALFRQRKILIDAPGKIGAEDFKNLIESSADARRADSGDQKQACRNRL
jgi:hypothetical protein